MILILAPSYVGGHCLLLHDVDEETPQWQFGLSGLYQNLQAESVDEYFSGPLGDEDWRVEHDLDGDFGGFTLAASPPILGNKITAYLTYLTGDLEGSFSTQEISPTPEGPYPGEVSFDREFWEFGADILILNAVYGRVAYTTYTMDGVWDYGDPFVEPQKYDFEALEIGAGFRQDFTSAWSSQCTVGIDAYVGLQFFEHEHTEVETAAVAKSEGVGVHARVEANVKYKVRSLTGASVVVGVGYDYQNLDDDGVDLTNEGFFARLGIDVGF